MLAKLLNQKPCTFAAITESSGRYGKCLHDDRAQPPNGPTFGGRARARDALSNNGDRDARPVRWNVWLTASAERPRFSGSASGRGRAPATYELREETMLNI